MSSGNSAGSATELKIVGRVLNTIGVVFLSICVALAAALYDNISALERTAIGLAIAAFMVVGGEMLSRRLKNNWFPTTLMSAGYGLAYFFIYSTYYVPGLHMLDNPYACWVLGPMLGAIGTWHGSRNSSLRWFSSVFTLMVSGHALYHALTSLAVVSLFGASIKVAAIACFFGMIWCASLSSLYKRYELRFSYPGKNFEESANWLLYRVLHELYFVLAALNAMAMPLFLSSFEQAPLWWSFQAPILLALSWRNGNIVKHVVVGAMWAAAAVTLFTFNHALAVPVILSVPVSGLAMGLAYRYMRSTLVAEHRIAGYCGYLYAAVAVTLAVPYFQLGLWDAMPFWMIESLVLCGLGLLLRDRFVHFAGTIAGVLALVLFAAQWHTWTWALVAPVVACAYALSIAYSRISLKGGWKQTEFLPFGGEVVSVEAAQNLEYLWSWAGCVTLLAASFLLANKESTVIYWSLEALVLVALGFAASKIGYRLQGLLAFALAAAKLVVLDMSGGRFSYNPELAFTLYRSVEFGVLGASTLAASFLYFREERKLEEAAQTDLPPEGAEPVKHDDQNSAN